MNFINRPTVYGVTVLPSPVIIIIIIIIIIIQFLAQT